MTPDDLIAYLDGELSPEEQEQVERELARDPERQALLMAYCRQRLMLAEATRRGAASDVPAAQGEAARPVGAPASTGALRRRGAPSSLRLAQRRAVEPAMPWSAWVAAAACLAVVIAAMLALPKPSGRHPAPSVARHQNQPPEVAAGIEDEPAAAAIEKPLPATQGERAAAARDRAARTAAGDETPENSLPGEDRRPAVAALPSPEPAGSSPPGSPAAVPEPEGGPPPAASVATVAAVARVARAQGDVQIVTESGRSPAREGQDLFTGQVLETTGKDSHAIVVYPDATRLEAAGDTTVRLLPASPAPEPSRAGRGRRVELSRGVLMAQVPRQPGGRPMVFVAPHAEATVMGTRLTLAVTADGTRLEVQEGRVRLRRPSDGSSVDVIGGSYVVAAEGRRMTVARIPSRAPDRPATWRLYKGGGSAWQLTGDVRQGSFTLSGKNTDEGWQAAAAESEQVFDLSQGPVHAAVTFTCELQEDTHFAEISVCGETRDASGAAPSLGVALRNGRFWVNVNNSERILAEDNTLAKPGVPLPIGIVLSGDQVTVTAGGRTVYDGPHGLAGLSPVRVLVMAGSKQSATRYNVKVESLSAAQRGR